ncbi:hypothetical protein ACQ4PT_028587 [Festuca glaucescens]
MDDMERRLDCALMAYVGGSRPMVSHEQVADALELRAGIQCGAFTVHGFRPEDFLIVFAAPEFRDRVTSHPSLPFVFFTLYFRQWARQAQARRVAMKTKVSLAIEGVPVHAWEKEVVQQLVGTSCALDVLEPEMASRMDLGKFRAEAWTTDPEGIPPMRSYGCRSRRRAYTMRAVRGSHGLFARMWSWGCYNTTCSFMSRGWRSSSGLMILMVVRAVRRGAARAVGWSRTGRAMVKMGSGRRVCCGGYLEFLIYEVATPARRVEDRRRGRIGSCHTWSHT